MKWLLHKLFGFEYWAMSFGDSPYILRARTYKDGTKYVCCYGKHFIIGQNTGYHRNWIQVY